VLLREELGIQNRQTEQKNRELEARLLTQEMANANQIVQLKKQIEIRLNLAKRTAEIVHERQTTERAAKESMQQTLANETQLLEQTNALISKTQQRGREHLARLEQQAAQHIQQLEKQQQHAPSPPPHTTKPSARRYALSNISALAGWISAFGLLSWMYAATPNNTTLSNASTHISAASSVSPMHIKTSPSAVLVPSAIYPLGSAPYLDLKMSSQLTVSRTDMNISSVCCLLQPSDMAWVSTPHVQSNHRHLQHP